MAVGEFLGSPHIQHHHGGILAELFPLGDIDIAEPLGGRNLGRCLGRRLVGRSRGKGQARQTCGDEVQETFHGLNSMLRVTVGKVVGGLPMTIRSDAPQESFQPGR